MVLEFSFLSLYCCEFSTVSEVGQAISDLSYKAPSNFFSTWQLSSFIPLEPRSSVPRNDSLNICQLHLLPRLHEIPAVLQTPASWCFKKNGAGNLSVLFCVSLPSIPASINSDRFPAAASTAQGLEPWAPNALDPGNGPREGLLHPVPPISLCSCAWLFVLGHWVVQSQEEAGPLSE